MTTAALVRWSAPLTEFPLIGPVAFLRTYAESIQAMALALVSYEPGSNVLDDEESEYDEPVTQRFVPIARFEAELNKAIAFGTGEVGVSSEFVTYEGRRCHFAFGDVAAGAACPGRLYRGREVVQVVSSPGRWHFYARQTSSDFERQQADLLRTPGIDVKWIAAGLYNGFNVLRLSARNAERFPHAPYLLNPEVARG